MRWTWSNWICFQEFDLLLSLQTNTNHKNKVLMNNPDLTICFCCPSFPIHLPDDRRSTWSWSRTHSDARASQSCRRKAAVLLMMYGKTLRKCSLSDTDNNSQINAGSVWECIDSQEHLHFPDVTANVPCSQWIPAEQRIISIQNHVFYLTWNCPLSMMYENQSFTGVIFAVHVYCVFFPATYVFKALYSQCSYLVLQFLK